MSSKLRSILVSIPSYRSALLQDFLISKKNSLPFNPIGYFYVAQTGHYQMAANSGQAIDTTRHFFLYFFQNQWVFIRDLFEKRGWKQDEFGEDESTFLEI